MSKLSDFYTRLPPPSGSRPGNWQYVDHNPAPVWVEDEHERRRDWREFREWIVAAAAVAGTLIAA